MYQFNQTPDLQYIQQTLIHQELTLATAESCSGGLLATFFTELPGSSTYYLGGVTCYANAAKTKLLDVSELVLTEYGAVSEQVAKQMATGVCRVLGADFGVSLTGVAGPDGGSAQKPVGTVWCGLSYHGIEAAYLMSCMGSRQTIRAQAMHGAVSFLKQWIVRQLQG